MVNINLNNLPAVISLDNLSIVLGFSGNLDVGTVKNIILASKCNNLPIYFNDAMYGAEVCDSFVEKFDEDGDLSDVILKGVQKYIDIGRKTLIFGQPHQNKLSVQRFMYENIEYYSSDKHECHLKDVDIYIGNFYCDKEELLASGLLSSNKSKKKNPARPKGPSKQEQRVAVFKNWLATKANISITDDSKYQTCYRIIGEPTQDEVWKKLQDLDKKLFSAGENDFFKYQEIISFKFGTGAGRIKKP